MAAKRAAAAKSAPAPKPKANTKAKITKPTKSTKDTNGKPTAPSTDSKPKASATTAPKPRGRPKKPVTETEAKPAAKTAKITKATNAATPNGTIENDTKPTAPAKKTGTKRKTEDDAEQRTAVPGKKQKTLAKSPIINSVPKDRMNVFVFGEGSAGELGLGTGKKVTDVKRPRLNPFLSVEDVGVVQLSAGGMHVAALTHDNKIITWGVNDQGALGRDTTWEGGLRDMDADENSSDSKVNETELNPKESTPGEVDFSSTQLAPDTVWTSVAAGDSFTLANTDDGKVYGWGTFRSNEGVFGFTQDVHIAERPILIPELKDIVEIKAGANHALALSKKGAVFAWGSGQQNQLGRRVVERTKSEGLRPREFGLPKGAKNGITAIAAGSYHNFAVSKNGDVYGWGLNSFGQTGIATAAGEDEATVLKPQVIQALKGKEVVSIGGAAHHSLAATADGKCLVWGRSDGHQLGLTDDAIAALPEDAVVLDPNGKRRLVLTPQVVPGIQGKVVEVATSGEHNIVVTKEGKAWSWGFSANYQTGQGTIDDVISATMIDNSAVRETKLTGAQTGGQFGVVLSIADANLPNGK